MDKQIHNCNEFSQPFFVYSDRDCSRNNRVLRAMVMLVA
jgi:hypothetical protein